MNEFDEIINDPNFGRTMHSNPLFRNVFNRVVSGTSFSRLLAQFKFNEHGNLIQEGLKVRTPEGLQPYVYERKPDEAFVDYLRRSVFEYKRGFTQTRGYEAGLNYFSGGQTNFILSEFASAHDLSARVVSFKPERNERAILEDFVGRDSRGKLLGLIVPDQEQINILQMFDKNNNPVNLDTIFNVLGIDPQNMPSVFKRLKMFTSDREIGRVSDPGTKIKGILFDPTQFFGTNPQLRKAAQQSLAVGDVSELRKAYEIMSDGMSIITESGMKRNIGFMSKKIAEMEAELDRLEKSGGLKVNSKDHINRAKAINEMKSEIRRLRKGMAKGKLEGGFNIRVFGAADYLNPASTIDFSKGDAIYMSEARAVEFVSKLPQYAGMSPQAILKAVREADFITSSADIKSEIKALPGVRSAMTLFHQPSGSKEIAYSNSLTMATFGDQFDSSMGKDSYLMHSLKKNIEEDMEAIRNGDIKPGFLKMIEDLANEPTPTGLSASEIVAHNQSKVYAQRLKDFIEGGGDLRSNPVMAQQAMNTIRKHYFRRVNEDGVPRRVNYRGSEVEALSLRAPMRMSTRAHMSGATFAGMEVSPGFAAYNEQLGRFVFNEIDILAARVAQGGSDLDDALYMTLKYDTKARRLLYHSLRDPNAMGEFMFYDVDIATSRTLPSQIKALELKRKNIITELANSKNLSTKAKKLIAELDEVNDTMHRYFSGEQVMINGESIPQLDIPTIDLARQYSLDAHRTVFSPKGFGRSKASIERYSQANPGIAFVTSRQMGSVNEFHSRLIGNRRMLASDGIAPLSLFEFTGKTDFIQQGILKEDKIIKDALKKASESSSIPTTAASRRLTSSDILKRIEDESKGRGNLGKFVNQFAVIENYIQTYLNIDNYSHIDERQARAFQEAILAAIKESNLTTIEREAVIDAMVKTQDVSIVERIPEIMNRNAQKFGKLIKTMQGISANMGIGLDVGLDPYLYATRGTGMEKLLLEGYGTDHIRPLLLGENSPLAYLSNIFNQVRELENSFAEVDTKKLMQEINQNLLDKLTDFQPTPLEVTRAQQFLTDYSLNKKMLNETVSDTTSMVERLKRVLGGKPEEIFNLTEDSVMAASFDKLREWGLLDDVDSLDRQLLAVAKLAASQVADTGRLVGTGIESLMGISLTPDELPSMSNFFMGALTRHTGQQQTMLDRIGSLRPQDYEDFQNVLGQFFVGPQLNRLTSDFANKHVDNRLLIGELMSRVNQMRQAALHAAASQPEASDVAGRLTDIGTRLARYYSETSEFTPTTSVRIPGLDRYLMRQSADETADSVTDRVVNGTTQLMKRLDGKALRDLMEVRGVKRGAIGAGIFAGIGLLYGVNKDRSPEDLQGPPLLPGGSAYEEYPRVPDDLSSIYSSLQNRNSFSPGVLYKVNMSGNFDSNEMRGKIESITGSPVRSNVYNSRQTNSSYNNSQSILNGIMNS